MHFNAWQTEYVNKLEKEKREEYGPRTTGLVSCWANKWFYGCTYGSEIHDIIDKWEVPQNRCKRKKEPENEPDPKRPATEDKYAGRQARFNTQPKSQAPGPSRNWNSMSSNNQKRKKPKKTGPVSFVSGGFLLEDKLPDSSKALDSFLDEQFSTAPTEFPSLTDPVSILHRIVQKSKKDVKFNDSKKNGEFVIECIVAGKVVGVGSSRKKKDGKKLACQKAAEALYNDKAMSSIVAEVVGKVMDISLTPNVAPKEAMEIENEEEPEHIAEEPVNQPHKPVHPTSAIYQFASKSYPQHTVEFEELSRGRSCLKLSGKVIARLSKSVGSLQDMKRELAQKGIEYLKKNKGSQDLITEILERKTNLVVDKSKQIPKHILIVGTPSSSRPLPETNRGYQMMLKIGWDPSKGCGKNKRGPKEPASVKICAQTDRAGLGYANVDDRKTAKKFQGNVEDQLRAFAMSNEESIQFSNDMSNEERKRIHTLARKLGLKSKSKGKEPNRVLFVMKKKKKQRKGQI